MNRDSEENHLLLNPRLPREEREKYVRAWIRHVESAFTSHVGIATSGSTGNSGKLIALSKAALLKSAEAVNEHLDSDQSDIWMKTLPSFHVGGLGIVLRSELSGAEVVETKLEKWDAGLFLQELSASRTTLLSLVPTQLFDLVETLKAPAPKSLRAVLVGGGRLNPQLYQRARELGWPVLASFGLTECCSQVATARVPDDPRLFPLSHVRVRTSDTIEIASEALLTGQIVFTEDTWRFEDPKVHGWLKTEDCGVIEADGSLTIQGRLSDFVKVGGEGVNLAKLTVLIGALAHETGWVPSSYGIFAAADSRLGAKLVLITQNTNARAMVDRFNSRVAPFERIREVLIVKEMPLSALGKILRVQALALVGLEPLPNE